MVISQFDGQVTVFTVSEDINDIIRWQVNEALLIGGNRMGEKKSGPIDTLWPLASDAGLIYFSLILN